MIDWLGRLFESNGADRQEGVGSLAERIGLASRRGSSSGSVVDATERLDAEIGRARRYEHSLSLVALTTRPLLDASHDGDGSGRVGANGHVIETTVPQMVSLVAAAALREVLRESDVVCYHPAQDRFLVALAESDEDDAAEALRRIRNLFRERLCLQVHAGVARFPDDSLTRDGLVAKAVSRNAAARRMTDAGGSVATHGRTPSRSRPHAPPHRVELGSSNGRSDDDSGHTVSWPVAEGREGR